MNAILQHHLTVSESARLFGVSRQRMHQLFETYSIKTIEIHPRLKVVSVNELGKIPKIRKAGKPKKSI